MSERTLRRILTAILTQAARYHAHHVAPYTGLWVEMDAWRAEHGPVKPS